MLTHFLIVHKHSHARRAAAALAAATTPPSPSDAPWHAPLVRVTRCDDTCASAGDGTCDDGRAALGRVRCDVGTDCTDCGPWTDDVPSSMAAHFPTPIADLAADGVTDVLVTRTATDPPFLALFTDPGADVDVSGQLDAWRVVERGLTQIWRARLAGVCGGGGSRPPAPTTRRWLPGASFSPPPPPLVLDVGANFGWYSLYAAALGCRAVAWEPVPRFRAFLTAALLLNPGAPSSIDVRPAAACAAAGTNVTLAVPSRGVWGTASVEGANIDPGVDNGRPLEAVTAPCETVDVVMGVRRVADVAGGPLPAIAMLKADVEGFEPDVLTGAASTLAGTPTHPPPANVALEYSPGVYESRRRWSEVGAWPSMLQALRRAGFDLFAVPDSTARGDAVSVPSDWTSPLAPLPVITDAVLAADAADAARLADRSLACVGEVPAALTAAAASGTPWGVCGAIPEGLHPRSFRATFGHNTNVWAARPPATEIARGEVVGVLGPADRPRSWFAAGDRAATGMGGRPCATLKPSVQVIHRCRCTDRTVCGEEEEAAVAAAHAGELVPEVYAG